MGSIGPTNCILKLGQRSLGFTRRVTSHQVEHALFGMVMINRAAPKQECLVDCHGDIGAEPHRTRSPDHLRCRLDLSVHWLLGDLQVDGADSGVPASDAVAVAVRRAAHPSADQQADGWFHPLSRVGRPAYQPRMAHTTRAPLARRQSALAPNNRQPQVEVALRTGRRRCLSVNDRIGERDRDLLTQISGGC